LPVIQADPDLLYKVFYHLVMNAIKYTPDGGKIMISGHSLNDNSEGPGIEVIVSDTGIGIDPQHHELVFEKFFQTGEVLMHSSGKTKFKGGGPGLGLAIAHGIIEVHHGKIWVESPGHDEEKNPGSSFHIRLPLSGAKIK
jgi:signal transduction histidine kinase